jgi:Tol biopolymer transport system component
VAFDDQYPVFSPDGHSIAFTSSRGLLESTNVWVMSAQGGEPHILTTFDIPGTSGPPEWAFR